MGEQLDPEVRHRRGDRDDARQRLRPHGRRRDIRRAIRIAPGPPEAYDGATASQFTIRHLAHLTADRYVVSFHRHGSRGCWQSEAGAIAARDSERAIGSSPQSSKSLIIVGTESGPPALDAV